MVQDSDDEPQHPARAVRDPTHPHASPISGVIPPPEHRFQPGNRANPGGRPKGADVVAQAIRELAKGAKFDDDGEVIEYGDGAKEVAQTWLDISTGKKDPSSVDSKALLALVDRCSGPIVKERVQTNIELTEGITLVDRRKDAPPVPGSEGK